LDVSEEALAVTSRILFVDSEFEVLTGLRRVLRSQRDVWDMRFVKGANAALRILEEEAVDVVVSDFSMPGLDGGELLTEVRRRYPEAARLILSGKTPETDLMRAVAIAHQFLTKPCEPDELIAAVERTLRLRDQLGHDWLRADLAGIDALPSPPSALNGLLAVLDSPRSGVRDVAEIVQQDIAFATKVLQVVNSSYFAPRSRITSLELAIAHLGIGTIRSLVLSDEVMRTLRLPNGELGHWLNRINAHALETAVLARHLAAPDAKDDAFCAGLLHECGQLVFAACRPGVFLAHLSLRERECRPLGDIERETFGVTHAQAGSNLLSLWGFPTDIVEAVAGHADLAEPELPGRPRAAAAVGLAHRLVESESMRLCTAPDAPGVSDQWLAQAGLLDAVRAWRSSRDDPLAAAS
jgi:HD-like signal output (HDOD) protein/CheY-like chemotaxis protein